MGYISSCLSCATLATWRPTAFPDADEVSGLRYGAEKPQPVTVQIQPLTCFGLGSYLSSCPSLGLLILSLQLLQWAVSNEHRSRNDCPGLTIFRPVSSLPTFSSTISAPCPPSRLFLKSYNFRDRVRDIVARFLDPHPNGSYQSIDPTERDKSMFAPSRSSFFSPNLRVASSAKIRSCLHPRPRLLCRTHDRLPFKGLR